MATKQKKFSVRFRGVRGSHPVPGPATVRIGGNTSCVQVQAGDQLMILDAGTGIIGLGNDLAKAHTASGDNITERAPITFTLLYSHTHYDHIQGFAFFKPAYIPTTTAYIFGPRLVERELEEGLSRAMIPPYFPVQMGDLPSSRTILSLQESEVIVYKDDQPQVFNFYRDDHSRSGYDIRIRPMRSFAHPNGGVFVYRIEVNGKSVVYATDTEGYVGGDQRVIQFAAGCDLLIHDSQYMPADYVQGKTNVQGYGHSTVDMAAEVAQKANVRQLALFHYDPQYDDAKILEMEKRAQGIFKNSIAAYEGLEIEL